MKFFENVDFQSTLFTKECAQFLSALFIIFTELVSLTMTSFIEKVLMHSWFDAQLDQKILDGL